MGEKAKLLIIEDEVRLLKALETKFLAGGYTVLTASNGKDGLEIALEELPDMILLDIIMPEMDGITMLEKLRENKRGKDIPVLILTNLSDSRAVEKSMTKGAFDYLIKSNWDLDDVLKKVQKKLGR